MATDQEFIHIDDWQLIDSTPDALRVENDEKPFISELEPNPRYENTWLPREHAMIRENDELWVKEWLALDRGMI